MNTLRTLAALVTLALMILPAIAPLLPASIKPVAAAAAQTEQPYIKTTVDSYDRIIGCGSDFKVMIYDPNASASTVYANVTVAGSLNKNVEFKYDAATGYYVAEFKVQGLTADCTKAYVEQVYPVNRTLAGTLTENQQMVVIYKASNNQTLTAALTYKTFEIIVRGRLHGSAYWIPRLLNVSLPSGNYLADLYAAENEWRILLPGYTGDNATVLLVIKDLDTGYKTNATIVFVREAAGSPYFKPKNATEAKKITEMLINVSKQLQNTYYIRGTNFNNPLVYGDTVLAQAAIYETGQTTKAARLAIFKSDAIVTYHATSPTKPIVVTIYDADADLDATNTTENMTAEIGSWFNILVKHFEGDLAAAGPVLNLSIVEAGENGVFQVVIDPLKYASQLYPAVINEYDNVINWHMLDLRVDSETTYLCNKFDGDVVGNPAIIVPFHTMSFNVVEDQVTIRYQYQCCPIAKITLHVVDADSDRVFPPSDVVARAEVPPNTPITNVWINYTYYDAAAGKYVITKLPAYNLSIYAVMKTPDNKTVEVPVTTANNAELYLAFHRVARNTIELQINLTLINWTSLNEYAAANGLTITGIKVYLTDRFAVNKQQAPEPYTASDYTKIQSVSISIDRTVIPIADKLTTATGAPEANVDAPNGNTAQIIHVTVTDDGRNFNCCEVDTISSNEVHIELIKTDKNGRVLIYVAGDGQISIPLYQINPDGTKGSQVGECYIELSNLVETGANTGVFTGVLKIYYENATDGLTYAGCPSSWLNGSILRLTYISPTLGRASTSAVLAFEDAKIMVVDPNNWNKEITTVKFGTPVKVIVYDPDANLDNQAAEGVRVEYKVYTLGGKYVTGYLWIYQLPNETDTAWFRGNATLRDAYYAFSGSNPAPGRIVPIKFGSQYVNMTLYDEVYIDFNLLNDYSNAPNVILPNPCSYCMWINFTYVDQTPNDAKAIQLAQSLIPKFVASNNGQPLDWAAVIGGCVSPKEHVASVHVEPSKGKVYLYYTVDDADTQAVIMKKMKEEYNESTIWQEVTNKTGVPAVGITMFKIVLVDSDKNLYVDQDDANTPYGSATAPTLGEYLLKHIWIRIEGISLAITLYDLQQYTGYPMTITEVAPGVYVIGNFSLENITYYLASQLNIKVRDPAQLLAGKKIYVYYGDDAAQCPPSPAQCSAAGATITTWTKALDMNGKIEVVDATTGKPKPYYSCSCPLGSSSCPSGGDVVKATVTDITLLDLYHQAVVSGYYDLFYSANDTRILELMITWPNNVLNWSGYNLFDVITNTTAGYKLANNVGFGNTVIWLEETSDGVYIPVVNMTAIARIFCSGSTGAGRIIAASGENVTFYYYDLAGSNGKSYTAEYTIYVGAPPVQVPPNKASNVTETMTYLLQGNKFVPVTTLKVGEPAYISIKLEYNPTTMKQVLKNLGGAGDAFYVLIFVEYNSTGKLAIDAVSPAYGFQPVKVGDMTTGFGFTPLKPGTYKIVVVPVLSPDNPIPVGSAKEIVVTVTQ